MPARWCINNQQASKQPNKETDMTTISINSADNTIRVNGRAYYAGRFEQIEKTGSGKWQGKASGYDFTIFGGKAAGAASNEWFVRWDAQGSQDFVKCGSAVEAINWINNQ
jgi:hypothetical protein